MYNPTIGKWNAVDPLSEMYSSESSYHYGLNNPIRYLDPNGMNSTEDWKKKHGLRNKDFTSVEVATGGHGQSQENEESEDVVGDGMSLNTEPNQDPSKKLGTPVKLFSAIQKALFHYGDHLGEEEFKKDVFDKKFKKLNSPFNITINSNGTIEVEGLRYDQNFDFSRIFNITKKHYGTVKDPATGVVTHVWYDPAGSGVIGSVTHAERVQATQWAGVGFHRGHGIALLADGEWGLVITFNNQKDRNEFWAYYVQDRSEKRYKDYVRASKAEKK